MACQQGNILTLLPETFVVVKFSPDEIPPPFPQSAMKRYSFLSVTMTPEECSLIAPENFLSDAPNTTRDFMEIAKDWRCFKVEGPLDFGLVGILHKILDPLKSAKISVLAVGTYNTDYFLVKREKLEEACAALKKAGFQINE